MTRLIDADRLLGFVDFDKAVIGEEHEASDIIAMIKTAPTVDAEPIRHGKWINISEPDENGNVQCYCSACGAGDLHAKNMVVPYCWKCGAKMGD